MRNLASVQRIAEIRPIENADSICQYRIDGWWVVDSIGKYDVGELVIYCEIDSWIPHDLAPFLSKGKEPREYLGIKGEKLRTIKLRGALSQGLLLKYGKGGCIFVEGDDITEELGIVKYEPPIPAQLAGLAKGNFPSFIPKTDQTRAQSLQMEIAQASSDMDVFEVTLKLDGSSCTVYYKDGEVGVCSRNIEFKLEGNDNNSFINAAIGTGLLGALKKIGRNIAVQAELMGPGIQGNREGFNGLKLFIFNIFDIDMQKYLPVIERYKTQEQLFGNGYIGNVIPLMYSSHVIHNNTIDYLLRLADTTSINHKVAEGLVFKRNDGKFSFKVINNKFLLKEKD